MTLMPALVLWWQWALFLVGVVSLSAGLAWITNFLSDSYHPTRWAWVVAAATTLSMLYAAATIAHVTNISTGSDLFWEGALALVGGLAGAVSAWSIWQRRVYLAGSKAAAFGLLLIGVGLIVWFIVQVGTAVGRALNPATSGGMSFGGLLLIGLVMYLLYSDRT